MNEFLWAVAVGAAFGAGRWFGWRGHRAWVARAMAANPQAWLDLVAQAIKAGAR